MSDLKIGIDTTNVPYPATADVLPIAKESGGQFYWDHVAWSDLKAAILGGVDLSAFKSNFDTHVANPSAHHARYTDAEAVDAIKVDAEWHTHANKSVLDQITSTKLTNWDAAYSNSHIHNNKTYLDTISQALATTSEVTFAKVTAAGNIYMNSTNLVAEQSWVTTQISNHAAGASAHHTRYADSEAVAAIKADAAWNATNWDAAHGWGDHALVGYLTTISGINISKLYNDVGYLTSYINNYITGVSGSGNGTLTVNRSGLADLTADLSHTHTESEITDLHTRYADSEAVAAIKSDAAWNAANWDTAYGWGDHALVGYLTTISGINISKLYNDVGYLTSYINNYITGVSGSGNGTLTVSRSGLSDLTADLSHTHTIASTDLTDMPTTLTSDKWIKVKNDASGYELVNAPAGSPVGSDGAVQYNNDGSFGGTGMVWDDSVNAFGWNVAAETDVLMKIKGDYWYSNLAAFTWFDLGTTDGGTGYISKLKIMHNDGGEIEFRGGSYAGYGDMLINSALHLYLQSQAGAGQTIAIFDSYVALNNVFEITGRNTYPSTPQMGWMIRLENHSTDADGLYIYNGNTWQSITTW